MTVGAVKLMVIGFGLLLIGVLLPFLMVLRLIEPSFPLSFLAYACSLTGLVFGLLGAFQYVRLRR